MILVFSQCLYNYYNYAVKHNYSYTLHILQLLYVLLLGLDWSALEIISHWIPHYSYDLNEKKKQTKCLHSLSIFC